MQAVTTWDALQACIARVPRGAPGYTTNLYATRAQVEHWCVAGLLHAIVAPGAVLILRDDRDFQRIYHAAENAPALSTALRRLSPGSYVCDLVGHSEALEQACAAYTAAGFASHAFLRRMARGRVDGDIPGDVVAVSAQVEDAPAVAALLERLLDPYTEQIPDRTELARAAANDRLLVVRRESGIAGMLMFDVHGYTTHLRFWHVDADSRGSGIGRRLMAGFLARCAEARRIVLWVIGDNDRSIAIYRHYGFADDGLLDKIMILHKDHDQ